MVRLSYSMFASTACAFRNFYEPNRRAHKVIESGFVERDGVFLLQKYSFRLSAADRRFCMDETGIEMFVNDIGIYGYSEFYRTAQLYIVADCLISKWQKFRSDMPISVMMSKHDDFGQIRFHVRREGQHYYREDVAEVTDSEIAVVQYLP